MIDHGRRELAEEKLGIPMLLDISLAQGLKLPRRVVTELAIAQPQPGSCIGPVVQPDLLAP